MRDAGYVAFVDSSGGSQDSMTLAIAHLHGGRVILDCVRERKPPFSPADVGAEFAGVLKAYSIRRISGDRYAGEWPREQFRLYRIWYDVAENAKGDIYRGRIAVAEQWASRAPGPPAAHSAVVQSSGAPDVAGATRLTTHPVLTTTW